MDLFRLFYMVLGCCVFFFDTCVWFDLHVFLIVVSLMLIFVVFFSCSEFMLLLLLL